MIGSHRGRGHDSTGIAGLKHHAQELNAKRIAHAPLTFHKVIILKLFLKVGKSFIVLS